MEGDKKPYDGKRGKKPFGEKVFQSSSLAWHLARL
jgi:hypothetical protein